MGVRILYESAAGRRAMQLLQHSGLMAAGAWFLHTPLSRLLIPGYIRRNEIDMTPYGGQKYDSFAAFFARRRADTPFDEAEQALISPCDGLLRAYPITETMSIPMKGSHYRLTDLVPVPEVCEGFRGGLCLVFRLRAQDYHHFCCFDDAWLGALHHIPGQLHSVQPIACETVPVYRLNRRWWQVLDTAHFGRVVQMEVGAMLVGGVSCHQNLLLQRGAEMGHFTLAGSTVLLLLSGQVRERLCLMSRISAVLDAGLEIPVTMGQRLGELHHEG